MIDTIEIGISKDFEFDKKGSIWRKTFTRGDTGEVLESYFYNDEVLNINIDGKGLSIKTNLSKLYGLGDNNFYPLGVGAMSIAINETLPRLLDNIGIICDLDKAKVWRLDLFKNVSLSKPYGVYKDILQTLNLKRTNTRQYPEGYLIGNTLREVMFYNKIRELKEKMGFSYVRQLGFNDERIMRGEIRFLKHRENKRNGIEYLKEIPDKWNSLKEVYSNYMREIFKYDFKGGGELDIDTLKTLINTAMVDLTIRGKWALEYYGLYPFTFVNKNDLLNALDMHFSRRQVYRILGDIEKAKKEYSRRDKDYKRLYDELKNKFTGEG